MSTPGGFKWSDRLLLGHGETDRTHKEFVELVDTMLSIEDLAFPSAFHRFVLHAEEHFGQEDAWMRSGGYPASGRDCHIDEHAKVLESVYEVRERVAAGDLAIGRRLARELSMWFPAHVDYMDSALSKWMTEKRFGAAPVVIRRSTPQTAQEEV